MAEENKNRWNELPITIRRRVEPEQLDSSFNLILLRSGPMCDHIYETTPEDERLDKYLNIMIHQLVLKNLDPFIHFPRKMMQESDNYFYSPG
jgi:hypothetical protein